MNLYCNGELVMLLPTVANLFAGGEKVILFSVAANLFAGGSVPTINV